MVASCAVLQHRELAGTGRQTPQQQHFSSFLSLFFFFSFQGPIGLDGKPVSKQLLSGLCALPPAVSHCPVYLPAAKHALERVILQCHAHAWIKRKLEGWQAGGYHKCLGGDAGVKR